jgi:FO synthase
MSDWQTLRGQLLAGDVPSDEQALSLAQIDDTASLVEVAAILRDRGHRNVVTYSRKVFIPLTHLCRDVCHYCTFARTPKKIDQPYMAVDDVLELCRQGARMGCQEALFTLGEKPELRYSAARQRWRRWALPPHWSTSKRSRDASCSRRDCCRTSTPVVWTPTRSPDCARSVHPWASCWNPPPSGCASAACRITARPTRSRRGDCRRWRWLARPVPFTSGILIGIGETRRERIESLLALRELHQRYGHIQEIIVQNFRAKPGTLMANAPEPDLNELLWTIAVARLVFGARMNIQAPPNLSPGVLPQLVAAGINDWGGVSPLTPGPCESRGAVAAPRAAGE